MDKNISIADRVNSFKVLRSFKIGKVRFEKDDVYNRLDIVNSNRQFFIMFDYNETGLVNVNEISLNKFRKNYKRIKNFISILEYTSDKNINQGFMFDTIKSIRLEMDFNGLEKGWEFNRDSVNDLFTYEVCTLPSDTQVCNSYSFNQDALIEMFKKHPVPFVVTSWLDSKKEYTTEVPSYEEFKNSIPNINSVLDNVNDCIDAIKTSMNYEDSVQKKYDNLKKEMVMFRDDSIKLIEELESELEKSEDKFNKLNKELKSLIKDYQERYDNIDIVDELEFNKIEEGTVLENILTVLKHLNKMI